MGNGSPNALREGETSAFVIIFTHKIAKKNWRIGFHLFHQKGMQISSKQVTVFFAFPLAFFGLG